MKKIIKVIRIEPKYPLLGAYQVFPLLSSEETIQLHGFVGRKNVKIKEILVVYEEKLKKFRGFVN